MKHRDKHKNHRDTNHRDDLSAQSHIALQEHVRQRAYEIWKSRNNPDGDTSLEDWLQAEREVVGGTNSGPNSAQNRGTVVGNAGAPDRDSFEELGEA